MCPLERRPLPRSPSLYTVLRCRTPFFASESSLSIEITDFPLLLLPSLDGRHSVTVIKIALKHRPHISPFTCIAATRQHKRLASLTRKRPQVHTTGQQLPRDLIGRGRPNAATARLISSRTGYPAAEADGERSQLSHSLAQRGGARRAEKTRRRRIIYRRRTHTRSRRGGQVRGKRSQQRRRNRHRPSASARLTRPCAARCGVNG